MCGISLEEWLFRITGGGLFNPLSSKKSKPIAKQGCTQVDIAVLLPLHPSAFLTSDIISDILNPNVLHIQPLTCPP